MATHRLEPAPNTLHGHYSTDIPPVLTIQAGDTVDFRTLDAGWSIYDHLDPFTTPPKVPHDRERDPGHALCGPIAIAGAHPGMTLVVQILDIRTAHRAFRVAVGSAATGMSGSTSLQNPNGSSAGSLTQKRIPRQASSVSAYACGLLSATWHATR